MTSVLLRGDTQRDREGRWPCEDRGRNWSDAAPN